MKALKKLVKAKKGVSSLFIAMYIAMLTVILISTLFIGIGISDSSLKTYLKTEQSRNQEGVLITAKNESIAEINGTTIYESFRVNNTGTIPIKIRSLYVGGRFIYDPSNREDSYIAPQESKWFSLFPNPDINPPVFTDVPGDWTVTTERGTRSTTLIASGANNTPGQFPNAFYFGPLMLLFDSFNWRVPNGLWKSGWSIANDTGGVTWRIRLMNVDDQNRSITLNNRTCFTLVGNEQQNNKIVAWYIDPTLTGMTIPHDGQLYYMYYTWVAPYDKAGHPQMASPSGMPAPAITTNFLTFTGNFEQNASQPFGQTIPFEAVLVTDASMAANLALTANPINIPNTGTSYSTITATVTDGRGNPLPNAQVTFYTSAGELSSKIAQTNANGIAQVTLRSSTTPTTATVAGLIQGIVGYTQVTFTPATKILVSSNPASIRGTTGSNSTITMQLADAGNNPIRQPGVTLNVQLTWSQKQGAPTIAPVTVITDPNGRATAILTAQGKTGTATVTASASGLTSGSTTVQLTP